MAIIAIDFDGTLVNGDKSIDGAKAAINLLREQGHKIIIHSCNNKTWIEKTLNNLDIRFDRIWCADSVDKPTTFRNDAKPVADIYIDDKGYYFQGNWSAEVLDIIKRVEGKDNRKW